MKQIQYYNKMTKFKIGDQVMFRDTEMPLEIIDIPDNPQPHSTVRMRAIDGSRIVRCEFGAFLDKKIIPIRSESDHKI
jgi:hypothetical protein